MLHLTLFGTSLHWSMHKARGRSKNVPKSVKEKPSISLLGWGWVGADPSNKAGGAFKGTFVHLGCDQRTGGVILLRFAEGLGGGVLRPGKF